MSVSNSRQTFIKPMIPFSGTLLGGLSVGDMIVVQGSAHSDADRFQVDLTCGSSVCPRADVAFHLNPRFVRGGCVVVCNSLQGGRWGREQNLNLQQTPGSPAAFTTGGDFELIILVLSDKYKVAVNGDHLLDYKHRVELQRVDTVCVSGKVRVEVVGVASSPGGVASSPGGVASPAASGADTLALPFSAALSDGLSGGRSLTIRAETNHDARSFCVNLTSGGGDIALHLNPRLRRRTWVRNSFLSGSWGPEELDLGAFPFAGGQYFEMIVRCEPGRFRVAVNGIHQLDYRHRVQDLRRIRTLEVQGDVALLEVRVD